jgi:hypothetical protein
MVYICMNKTGYESNLAESDDLYYCAVGDQGRVIALATPKDLKTGSGE